MGHRIEVAKSGRSKCVVCDDVIAKGAVRLAEETRDIGIPDLIHRFFHLECAAAVHPELVANALQHVAVGVDFDRAKIEAKIAPAIARAAEARKAKYLAAQAEKDAKAVVIATDDTSSELLAQLEGNPEDPGTLAVVADQLQARGDIRGELIALQLGAASTTAVSLEGDDDEETDASDLVSDAERRSRRTAELMDKLTVPLDPGDKVVWGVGFVRRLELHHKNGTRLSALAAIWKHPSLRFLSELCLSFSSNLDATFITRLDELLPETLRVLELGGNSSHALAGTATLIAQLPRLERAAFTGKLATEALAHPTLRRLDICPLDPCLETEQLVPKLAPKLLTALDTLTIHPQKSDGFAVAVSSLGAKWFERLATFGWVGGNDLVADDLAYLAKALGKRKLPKLDLTGTKVPLGLRDKLAGLCAELVAPDLLVNDNQTIFIEHVNKPEWGRGKLVRKHEGKLEVQFPQPIGLKMFKADAPFLKLLA